MRIYRIIFGLFLTASAAWSQGLPVITLQPTNQLVPPGSNVVFLVGASGATGYQWRFNGDDISGATGATLTITNAQGTNHGYYVVVVKNDAGWVPSQLVYLAVVAEPGGVVPLSNYNNTNEFGQARYHFGYYGSFTGPPMTNGTAQVVAGPELDQMQPINFYYTNNLIPGHTVIETNYQFQQYDEGYFYAANQIVTTVNPGQTVYYRVLLLYPYQAGLGAEPSTTKKLIAGGGPYPVPAADDIQFIQYIEWPAPIVTGVSPTNQIVVAGQTLSLTNYLLVYGPTTNQWRKDGILLSNTVHQINLFYNEEILTIPNVGPQSAGIYDCVVLGHQWLITPKIAVSIALNGAFHSGHLDGTNLVWDFAGAVGRSYVIEWSTNLTSWTDLFIITNLTGNVTLTNALPSSDVNFYRSRLLP